MSMQAGRDDALILKIRGLPPEKVAEVEDFVEFLAQRDDRRLTQAARIESPAEVAAESTKGLRRTAWHRRRSCSRPGRARRAILSAP
jgi:hypothetical protein